MSKINNLPHDHNPATEVLLETMPPEESFSMAADLFSVLADPTRAKILWLLCHTEDCVVNIAAAMNMSSPAVSHHLRILKQAGILSYRKDGKEAYYRLGTGEKAIETHKIIDAVFNMNCIIGGAEEI